MSETNTEVVPTGFNTPEAVRHRKLRHTKDVVSRHLMTAGGISVLLAIVLIAFYLVWVVIPLFLPASMHELATYATPSDQREDTLYYALEEQHEVGIRVTASGRVAFFNAYTGEVILEDAVITRSDVQVTAFSSGDPVTHLLAFGLDNGHVQLAYHNYSTTYPDDVRLITPSISRPFNGESLELDPRGHAIVDLAAQANEDETTIAAYTDDGRLLLSNIMVERSFLTGEETLVRTESTVPLSSTVEHLIVDIDQRELYFTDSDGWLYYYDITDKENPRLVQRVQAVNAGIDITALDFLSGGISVLVGTSAGTISQWFPVRDQNNNSTLQKIRSFDSQHAAITRLVPEYYRKGFLALDESGELGVYHATAHRTVKLQQFETNDDDMLAIAPRANALILEDGKGGAHLWALENEHPEVSWQSIWGKVWYESRDQPEFIWQSSSASNDFEPKFSLTPLAFGTMKASLYAMIIAIPLAIMGAIYTAYFMAPGLRNIVKPSIEIMAALPTVILGFLAGLWFAPIVESYLPAMLLIFLAIPLAILLTAYSWRRLPGRVRQLIPHGWESVLLVPVIILTTAAMFWISKPLEVWLFDGNLPLWLTQELGIAYDQRNSFVVGIAIGFAVIPTIFSISEDAIFGVPRHLTTGSLALGATPWQTMARVILLTASPGIFSAVMIGLGRAVGETMIVVMATGNTAIMDLNMFEGFRALSANIAVEMPESELGSTHYRILFLAGLVLFIATFLFNTIAEVVRQRLRTKYSTL